MKRLRIVHCFRSPVGGIFRHVRDLTEAQIAAGHDVGIICDSSNGSELEESRFEALRERLALGIHRTPMQRHIGPRDIASAWRTYRIIKSLQPDVLHGHGAKGGVHARLFGSFLRVSRFRVARLYSPHGGSLHYDERALKGKAFFAIERGMSRLTDTLLFVSEYERATYRRKVGEPSVPNVLVYNGLRQEEFEPVAATSDAADILYIGMMRDLKGPDIFIDAMAGAEALLERRLSAVMVGDGDGLARYRAQAKELGLGDRIRFMPPMPARDAFALARLVVVPSRAEAMPYIVLETLAAAKPLIATGVGGIPEILGTGSSAMVEPDPGQLAGRVSEALGDLDAYAARMPAIADLKARFGADVMAGKIESAYLSALDR